MKKALFEGMGKVIRLFPVDREPGFSLPSHSDAEAIGKDWKRVGDDMLAVAENLYRVENTKKISQKNHEK